MNHPNKKAAATLPLVRCAIYTRKSTEASEATLVPPIP